MIDTLTQLGLSANEAAVYSTLVELGPCFVAPIVQKTKKHRQIIYNALESLEKKNLVVVLKRNGKNLYTTADPQRFLTDLKQKEVLAKELVERINHRTAAEKEKIELFSGHDGYLQGIADFRHRALEAGEYIAIRGECKGWFDFMKRYFKEHVDEVRKIKHRGIDINILFFEDERDKAEEFIGPYLKNPYTCKIAAETHKLPHTAWLAGDHVYMVTPAVDPLVVHIKSKALAEQYRQYFWHVWSQAKPLKLS